jgi:hypothetical protein
MKDESKEVGQQPSRKGGRRRPDAKKGKSAGKKKDSEQDLLHLALV